MLKKKLPQFFLFLCLVFLVDYRKIPGAEYLRFLGTENLLKNQSLILDSYEGKLGVDKAKFNGHWFSTKSIGSSILELPAMFVFSVVHSENTKYFLVRLLGTLFVVFLLLIWVQEEFGIFIALAVLLGTPFWEFWRFTHPDLVAGGLILYGIFSYHKRKIGISSALFGLVFLIRLQLILFTAPVLFLYSWRFFKEKKFSNALYIITGTAVAVLVQLYINQHYFGHPFHFVTSYWAPESESFYTGIPTVFSDNPAMRWSFPTLQNIFFNEFGSAPSILKWMPWFYIAWIAGLWKNPDRWALWIGALLFHIYQMGLPLPGFRYYSFFCFLMALSLKNFPKLTLYLVILYGLAVVNIPEEIRMISEGDNQPLLWSKFNIVGFPSLIPVVLCLFLWIYLSLKSSKSAEI